MAQNYTLREAARELKADYKTLRNWLKEAGIELHPDTGDKRLKLLSREQVEHLAVLHKRTLTPLPPAPTTDPLTALYARLHREFDPQLAAILERLTVLEVKPAATPPETRSEAQQTAFPDAPTHLPTPATPALPQRHTRKAFTTDWRAQDFLVDHGVPAKQSDPWKAEIPRESREAALLFAQTKEQAVHRCRDDACPCHQMLD